MSDQPRDVDLAEAQSCPVDSEEGLIGTEDVRTEPTEDAQPPGNGSRPHSGGAPESGKDASSNDVSGNSGCGNSESGNNPAVVEEEGVDRCVDGVPGGEEVPTGEGQEASEVDSSTMLESNLIGLECDVTMPAGAELDVEIEGEAISELSAQEGQEDPAPELTVSSTPEGNGEESSFLEGFTTQEVGIGSMLHGCNTF